MPGSCKVDKVKGYLILFLEKENRATAVPCQKHSAFRGHLESDKTLSKQSPTISLSIVFVMQLFELINKVFGLLEVLSAGSIKFFLQPITIIKKKTQEEYNSFIS